MTDSELDHDADDRERGRRERAARRHEIGRPDVTEHEIGQRTYLVAQVEPLDVDGVITIAAGVAVWVAAFVVLLFFTSTLRADGRLWWLWTCGAGAVLGLVGLEYCRRRRRALHAQPSARRDESSRFGAAG